MHSITCADSTGLIWIIPNGPSPGKYSQRASRTAMPMQSVTQFDPTRRNAIHDYTFRSAGKLHVGFTRDRGTNFTLDTRIDKHDARERERNRRNYSLYDDKAGRGNKYVHGPQGLSRSLTLQGDRVKSLG